MNKVKLMETGGENPRFLDAEINESGDLVFSGQDLGPIVEGVLGDSDYEYWLTIKSRDKDSVLIALMEIFFKEHKIPFNEFRELLESKEIPSEFSSY